MRLVNVKPRLIKTGSYPLYIHDEWEQTVSKQIANSGCWESKETELMWDLLEKADLFIDVGAHIGWYTVLAIKRMPRFGIIMAFEPEQENWGILKANIKLHNEGVGGNWDRARSGYGKGLMVAGGNVAVGGAEGESVLHLHATNSGDHRTYDVTSKGRDRTRPTGSKYTVRVVTLDRAVPRIFKWQRVVIKMDIQGAEGLALPGAQRLLFRDRPERLDLVMEFWPWGLQQAGTDFEEVVRFLGQVGQIRLLEKEIRPIDPDGLVSLGRELLANGQHTNLWITT